MKAMKAMKKKSIVGRKASVFKGTKAKTSGGLQKSSLMISKSGKIVSKKASAASKKKFTYIKAWADAFKKARAALGIKGFVPIKKGSALYKKTKELFEQ